MKLLISCCILILITTLSYANENENRLKGIILSRISQLITYKQGREEFNVCIYKDDDMYNTFRKLYKDKKYKKLPIQVFSIGNKEDLYNCDIFYSSKIDDNLREKINRKHLIHTLLVSDRVDKLYEGFIMALYLKDKKIKIAINHGALLKTELNVNYRLLQAASQIINPVKVK
ncbi:YfiR family protein [Sulfurimonas sp. SAG-AH-194-C21]|nr:YfiR family protein [Sulfurimonas sp. SAG-AH-194-C21]MDF1883865.1 YfiR family protein [Sulfurimonas sp. SAG-AH-194-C21]